MPILRTFNKNTLILTVHLCMLLLFCFNTAKKTYSQDLNNETTKVDSKFSFHVEGAHLMDYFFDREHPKFYNQYNFGTHLKYSVNIDKYKLYDKLYRNPTQGIGLYSVLYNSKHFGYIAALYYNLEIPISNPNKKYFFGYTINGGLAYINSPEIIINFDDKNIISSRLNIYFELKLNFDYNKNASPGVSIGFKHYSNTALTLPNIGLNMLTADFYLTKYNNKKITADNYTIPKHKFYTQFSFALGTGARQIIENRERIIKNSLTAEFLLGISHKYRIAMGANCGFTWGQKSLSDTHFYGDINQLTSVSVVAGWDWIVHDKLYFPIRFGYYFKRNRELREIKPYYEKAGMAYNINNNLSANLVIKAHYFVADILEFNIIYNIRPNKNKS